jgi:hypothetical protein
MGAHSAVYACFGPLTLLEINYPEVMQYDALRAAVKDAWDKVGRHEFEELIHSMQDRCQAVIVGITGSGV